MAHERRQVRMAPAEVERGRVAGAILGVCIVFPCPTLSLDFLTESSDLTMCRRSALWAYCRGPVLAYRVRLHRHLRAGRHHMAMRRRRVRQNRSQTKHTNRE